MRRAITPVWAVACWFCAGVAGAWAQTEPLPAPSPQAVEALRLLQSSDAYQQQMGFLRLEALREPGALEAIRPYLQSRDPDTRAYSLRAVAAIEGISAVPLLRRALTTDRTPRVRRAALLGLEPFIQGSPEVLPTLIRSLRDPSIEVQITAADVVSRIDDPRAREAILTRKKRERQRDVRRALALAVARLKPR